MARKAIEKIINVEKMDFYWIGRAPIGYFTERWTDRVSSPFGQKVKKKHQSLFLFLFSPFYFSCRHLYSKVKFLEVILNFYKMVMRALIMHG